MANLTMAKITILEEAGKCIDVHHNAQDRRWPFYNLFPVSSGLGFFSARIMIFPGMVQSVFD